METDIVITRLVDRTILSEVNGTTDWEPYLNGTVYANDRNPNVIYLRLSGGEGDGKYARLCTLEETNT